MSKKEICSVNPNVSLELDLASDAKTIAIKIDGKICFLSPDAAMNISNELSEMSKDILSKEAESDIQRPEYWQDYLLEARHYNVSTSRLEIEGEIWVVDHDAIREFIEDYTMDNYSQFHTNLSEMAANRLISKED